MIYLVKNTGDVCCSTKFRSKEVEIERGASPFGVRYGSCSKHAHNYGKSLSVVVVATRLYMYQINKIM